MDKINILYTFDNAFWRMAAVSIKSLVDAQKNPEKLVVHCMVAKHTRGWRVIKKITDGVGAQLVWRSVSRQQNPFRKHDFKRWSPVVFYRLFSWQMFPNVDKMLYLDSDTFVMTDLTDLYNTDLSGYVLAAVMDMAPPEKEYFRGSKEVKYFEQNFMKHGKYVNSGVLLINQKKLAGCLDKLLTIQVPIRFPDQDIINGALDGCIKFLPLRYNFAPSQYISTKFSKVEATQALKNPAIYHFYNGKPYFYDEERREIYSLFYRACVSLGFDVEDFAKTHIKREIKKHGSSTNIPHLYLTKRGDLKLFGVLRV